MAVSTFPAWPGIKLGVAYGGAVLKADEGYQREDSVI
jgi:hypothetical protein